MRIFRNSRKNRSFIYTQKCLPICVFHWIKNFSEHYFAKFRQCYKTHIGKHTKVNFAKYRVVLCFARQNLLQSYRQKHRRLTLSESGEAGGQLHRLPAAAAADGGGCSPAAVAVAVAACTVIPAPQRTFLQTVYTFSVGDPDPDVFEPPGSGSIGRSEV
jgi:hypothetical protein